MIRRSLSLPITLAVVMIVLLVLLTVGWVILTARQITESAGVYVTLVAGGALFFVLVVVGVVFYLTLSIKAINITRRQSNFIDSVTHELKSPIASLKLYLQTLTRRDVPEKEQQEFLRFMLEDVDRLDDLINHVLDAARLDREGFSSQTEEVELSELLRACAEEVCLRHRCSPEVAELNLQSCYARGERVDLKLIFRNLLDNAIKYGAEPPQVQVQLAELFNGRIVVRISDNGEGIPIRFRQKIFSRFVRLGAELEREKTGTGLGLYIVRTLVNKLGGKIRVRGREKESGTVFEVTLPGRIAENDGKIVEANPSKTPN